MIVDQQTAKHFEDRRKVEVLKEKKCPNCGWGTSPIGALGIYRACLSCFRIFKDDMIDLIEMERK